MDRTRLRSERGTGLIGSAAGVVVFLAFVLLAVQVMARLSTATTVSAVGADAARAVASRRVDHADPLAVARAEGRAEVQARRLLGGVGRDAELTWSVDARTVRLRVWARVPGILPAAWRGSAGPGAIDRTFVAQIEQAR